MALLFNWTQEMLVSSTGTVLQSLANTGPGPHDQTAGTSTMDMEALIEETD